MAVTWALVAGCGFSASPTPDNPIVDATVGNEDMPMPGDMDGDGIADANDNCPTTSNSAQDDEDGDKKGDLCDPCPQLGTAADDLDTDGDGVGNGCDPRPTMNGDALAYWNGFNTPGAGLPEGLTTLHGNADRWSTSGGNLVYVANSDDWGMVMVDATAAHHTVDAQFTIISTRAGTAQAAGVAVDIATNDTDLFLCQSRIDTEAREMWRRNPQQSDGWSPVDSLSAMTPIDTYRIQLQRTAGDSLCTNTRLGQTSVPLSSLTNSLDNTRAGLFARNVEARFKYIAIYRSP
jgi:hypothetical protein